MKFFNSVLAISVLFPSLISSSPVPEPNPTADPSPSIEKRNFKDSCNNIGFDGRYLTADCRTFAGNYIHNNVDLNNCIADFRGVLRHPGYVLPLLRPLPQRQDSQVNARTGSTGRVRLWGYLTADCRTFAGNYIHNNVDLNNCIADFRGVLRHPGSGFASQCQNWQHWASTIMGIHKITKSPILSHLFVALNSLASRHKNE
ncbi:uncharacterized protein PAC_03299 [Phialocephala subalpina]|uniref:Cyanovirin-N domain-containing protein n=1 Tax=Phialocephala subalpina TaxID=576137 RepID=A0A1L7WKX8_9HELO|nr:uncharacterized protein PAC_03299 [Phialocephala subalpina]